MKTLLCALPVLLLDSIDVSVGLSMTFRDVRWTSTTSDDRRNGGCRRVSSSLRAIEPDYHSSSQHICVASVLRNVGPCLVEAGTCLAEAACILPNWYSSKEGLTGESPAVFGGAGTALIAAGQAMVKLVDAVESARGKEYDYGVADLFTAACSLDPVDLHENLEIAASALEEWISKSDSSALEKAATAFQDLSRDFCVYGDGLDQEVHSDRQDRETSGRYMRQAARHLITASSILLQG